MGGSGLGNGNAKSGNKGSNHNFEHRNLLSLGDIIAALAPVAGLATEATLISVLNAIVASDQDIEILLVRDTGNGDVVLQQITDYQTGVPVVTYKDVNGNIVVPVGPLEYLDPSAVLQLVLAELLTLNAGGQLLTEATFIAEDFATQTTLAALLTELQLKADLTETQPVSAVSLPLPTGAATQTTLAALLTELQLKADLSETQPVSQTNTVRTAGLLVVSGIANTTVAAGARSVTFFNQGPTAATVAGGVLDAGESISFDAGAQGDTLGAIAYVTIATGVLKIATVV